MNRVFLARTAIGMGAALTLGIALSGCSVLGGQQGEEVFTLEVGDCIDDTQVGDSEEVSNLPVVPCDEPHTAEAYLAYEFEDGDFPGEEVITTTAEEQCSTGFESFVGLAYGESELDLQYLYPTQMTWEDATLKDRKILCFVYDPAVDTISESLKGAAR